MTLDAQSWQTASAADPIVITDDDDGSFEPLGPAYAGPGYAIQYVRCVPYEVDMHLKRSQIQFSFGRYRSFCAHDSDKVRVEETRGPSASFLPAGGQVIDRSDPSVLSEHVSLVLDPEVIEEGAHEAGLPGSAFAYAWGIASQGLTEQSYRLRATVLAGARHGHDPLQLDQLVSDMVGRFFEAYQSSLDRAARRFGGLTPGQLRNVWSYVDANLTASLSLKDLADETGLSQHHFARQFKESTTVSPYTFVLERRLAWAKKALVACKLSLAEIAVACGFSDQAHFTKQFKKRLGITPARYRRVAGT